MRIFRTGHYRFSIISDDGSNLWIDNRYTINNDGLHGWRNREATKHLRGGWRLVKLEMFERGGHLGCCSGTGVPILATDGLLCKQEADGLASKSLTAMASSGRMSFILAKVAGART